jgi:citronellol/citronellal dehydrogenase
MASLKGRVALITGASRGIGRALALGLAGHGCDVVVAAKSTQSTEKLPGSIFTVAQEVEARGARVLPVPVDVRDEAQIDTLVARSVDRFGRIDILINNAGALWWRPVLETPAKRFDLVMGVNVRAAFLASRAVLPYMIKQQWGHIINMSPPLDLHMVPGRVAYSISKLGMTLLTHGLAVEVRATNIAVNSLWPVTIIESQASMNWGLGTPAQWRKPDILVDCVLRIVQKEPGELTGRALLDEDFLRAEGITDFSSYACVAGSEPPRIAWEAGRSQIVAAGEETSQPRDGRAENEFEA